MVVVLVLLLLHAVRFFAREHTHTLSLSLPCIRSPAGPGDCLLPAAASYTFNSSTTIQPNPAGSKVRSHLVPFFSWVQQVANLHPRLSCSQTSVALTSVPSRSSTQESASSSQDGKRATCLPTSGLRTRRWSTCACTLAQKAARSQLQRVHVVHCPVGAVHGGLELDLQHP